MTTINTNIGAISAQSNMSRVNDEFNTAMTRLSTGLRVNAAKDDAAGMAIGEKMTAQVMGLNQAVRNAADGKNLVDTTEGAHVEVSNMLQRLRELSVQSANDTNTASDRGSLQAEASQLVAEINRVAETTTFNGMNILDGTFKGKQLQIGADSGASFNIDVDSAKATDIGAHQISSEAGITDFSGETLTISGHSGSENVTTAAGDSAKDVAAKINATTGDTGVDAKATTTATLEGPQVGGSDAAATVSFTINSVQIDEVSVPASDMSGESRLSSLRDAINEKSSQTGVSTTINDAGNIVLTDTDGDDIAIGGFTFTNGAGTETMNVNVGADTHTFDAADATTNAIDLKGEVTMTSTKAFSVATDTTDDAVAGTESMLDTDTEQHFASSLSAVSEVDITTAQGASDAIKVIDVALSKISQSRSELGAVSNRLDSTISNLTNISVSVQAAKSQVMDADFAAESTNLARGQILSQAATAMLAQANSSKQGVLSLLRG